MSVKIILYNYEGHPQVINKMLNKVSELEGNFKQPLNHMNPTVNLSGSFTLDRLIDGYINYVNIRKGNENFYYYIMDYTITRSGLVEISLHLDVLKTYQSDVMNLEVILARSESGDGDIPDNSYPLGSGHIMNEYKFPKGFSEDESSGNYIMVTSQSGYSTVMED